METESIITGIGAFVGGGGLATVLNWRANKKKGKEEGKGMEIENIKKVVDAVYQPLIDQLNKRVADLTAENEQLRSRVSTQEKQIHGLQDQIAELYRLLNKDSIKQVRNSKGQYTKKGNGEA